MLGTGESASRGTGLCVISGCLCADSELDTIFDTKNKFARMTLFSIKISVKLQCKQLSAKFYLLRFLTVVLLYKYIFFSFFVYLFNSL